MPLRQLRQRAVHPAARGRSNTFFSTSFLQQQRLVTVQDLACVSNIHTEGNREHKVAPTKSDLKTARKGENSFLAMPSLLLMCCHTATCCRQRCLSWQRLIECFHFSPAFAVKMKTGCWGKEQLSRLEVIQCYKEPKLLQAGCVRGFCGVCSQGGLAKQSWEPGHCVRAWSLAPETCLLSHLEEIVTDLVL